MRVPCSTAEGMEMSYPALEDHSRRTNRGETFVIIYSWGIKAGNHKDSCKGMMSYICILYSFVNGNKGWELRDSCNDCVHCYLLDVIKYCCLEYLMYLVCLCAGCVVLSMWYANCVVHRLHGANELCFLCGVMGRDSLVVHKLHCGAQAKWCDW